MNKTARAASESQGVARPLTMAQIAGAPFPFGLTASPRDGAVAWIYNERGARNIWVARPDRSGRYCSRRLTSYTADDGHTVSGLAWNGDGQTLFYTRGGVWWDGAHPVNPLSRPEGPQAGGVWAVDASGGAPRHIGDGSAPAPSPRGDVVVFLRGGQPWVVRADGRSKATPLFIDRGQVSALAWSPDGARVAFLSTRSDHRLIGVYDRATQSMGWICPGIDQDLDPTWSPDGQRIAFIRKACGAQVPCVCHRQCTPWEIWVADAATGKGGAIWRANPGVGSCFRWLFNSRTSLFWGVGDRLVFPWEGTGWVRLYAIAARGGEPEALTADDSEVFGAGLSADRTRLIYASNEGDLDRRHIWELSLQSGRARQLTCGEGIEDLPVMTPDAGIFALHGEARRPLRPVKVSDGTIIDLAPQAVAADFPSGDLVVPQLITFPAADGRVIHGQLFAPRGRVQKGPAVLFFHGGPTERQMFAAWDPFETHTHLYESCQYLANHGYEVLSVNYRGGTGYGFEYREPPGFGAGGASELNDIIGAARYLLSRPEVDPKRLGVWGGSYGGRMTLLALSRASQYFAAGVSYAGICDWLAMPQLKLAGDPAAVALAHESGALAHLGGWRAPVLLVHGDADPIVGVGQTAALAAALRTRDIPVEILLIPDEVHFLLRHRSWIEVFTATKDYFDRHL